MLINQHVAACMCVQGNPARPMVPRTHPPARSNGEVRVVGGGSTLDPAGIAVPDVKAGRAVVHLMDAALIEDHFAGGGCGWDGGRALLRLHLCSCRLCCGSCCSQLLLPVLNAVLYLVSNVSLWVTVALPNS